MVTIALALTFSAAGCLKSHRLADNEFQRYWMLDENPTNSTTLTRLSVSGRKMPSTWIIRQTTDEAMASASQTKAIAAVKQETPPEELVVSVSYQQALQLQRSLAGVREGIESFEPLISEHTIKRPRTWGKTMADALVKIETLTREAAGPATADGRGGLLATPSDPILQMVVTYLNEHARGGLLSGLEGSEMNQLRQVLVQVMLRLGFAAAGKTDSTDVRHAVVEMMSAARDPAALQKPLANLLAEKFSQAPDAPAGSQLPGVVHVSFKAIPKAMQAIEILAGQWDRVQEVSLAFHKIAGRTAAVATCRVLPGKQVRLDNMLPVNLQPALVARGSVRMIVLPEHAPSGETVILFEPADDGSVQLRFEGPVYAIVRAMVLPLASGELREIRVLTHRTASGTSLLNVNLAMLDESTRGDARRLLVVQDVQAKRIVRTLTGVRSETIDGTLIVNYLTPDKRYVYTRVKTGQAAR